MPGTKPSLVIESPPPRSTAEEAAGECVVPLNSDSLHDLVGPANQMRSMADLILKKGHGTDADTEALLGFLQSSSERLQNLLDGLRTYLRIIGQRSPFRRFDANASLNIALAGLQDSIARSIALVTHDAMPEVYGDPNQICCVFANLIDNGIKFCGDRRPEIHIAAGCAENGWLFSIRDNGPGIDPRHSERIFGVFKRIQGDKYPGAGVGLPIARGILERHHGRIWVESTLGQGSVFLFFLPHAPAEPPD